MNAREQVQADYAIRDGMIVSPGKFEGEMLYVPYFWDLDGGGTNDDDDDEVVVFDVTDEDRAMFPELGDSRTVKLYEHSDGFVCEC